MALILLLELLSIAAFLKTAAVRRMFRLQSKNLASFAASLFCFCTFYFMDVGETVDSTWKFILLLALSYLFFHYALCFTIDEATRLCGMQHKQNDGQVNETLERFHKMTGLNDDLLSAVLEFLSFDECLSVCSVSHRFSVLGQGELSRRKKFTAKECLPLVFSDEMCFKLAERWWLNLCEFSASNCMRMTDAGVMKLAQECRGLTSIDLSSTAITDDTLDAVSAHSELLQKLNLSSCPNVTPRGIAMIAFRMQNLKSLLLMSTNITDLAMVYLAHGKPLLEELDVSYCFQISDYGLGEFLQHNAQQLKRLAIGSSVGIAKIPSSILELPLKELYLQRSPGVNDLVLYEIVKALPGLQVLDVSCTEVSSLSLRQVLLLCNGLEKLVIANPLSPMLVTDDLLPDANGLVAPALKELCLRGCSGLTDAFVMRIRDNESMLPHLKSLALEGCSGISDATLCNSQFVRRSRLVVSCDEFKR